MYEPLNISRPRRRSRLPQDPVVVVVSVVAAAAAAVFDAAKTEPNRGAVVGLEEALGSPVARHSADRLASSADEKWNSEAPESVAVD